MKNIPLGSIESKFYEKNGVINYKISPVLGLQTNVWGNFNLSKARVLENNEQCLAFKQGYTKIEMVFTPGTKGLEKVRVTKYIFDIIPIGIQFCNISVSNKRFLQERFKCI